MEAAGVAVTWMTPRPIIMMAPAAEEAAATAAAAEEEAAAAGTQVTPPAVLVGLAPPQWVRSGAEAAHIGLILWNASLVINHRMLAMEVGRILILLGHCQQLGLAE